MNCDNIEKLMTDLLAGELSERDRLEVERHIAGCESCTEKFVAFKKTWNCINFAFAANHPEKALETSRISEIEKEYYAIGDAVKTFEQANTLKMRNRNRIFRIAAMFIVLCIAAVVGTVVYLDENPYSSPVASVELGDTEKGIILETPMPTEECDFAYEAVASGIIDFDEQKREYKSTEVKSRSSSSSKIMIPAAEAAELSDLPDADFANTVEMSFDRLNTKTDDKNMAFAKSAPAGLGNSEDSEVTDKFLNCTHKVLKEETEKTQAVAGRSSRPVSAQVNGNEASRRFSLGIDEKKDTEKAAADLPDFRRDKQKTLDDKFMNVQKSVHVVADDANAKMNSIPTLAESEYNNAVGMKAAERIERNEFPVNQMYTRASNISNIARGDLADIMKTREIKLNNNMVAPKDKDALYSYKAIAAKSPFKKDSYVIYAEAVPNERRVGRQQVRLDIDGLSMRNTSSLRQDDIPFTESLLFELKDVPGKTDVIAKVTVEIENTSMLTSYKLTAADVIEDFDKAPAPLRLAAVAHAANDQEIVFNKEMRLKMIAELDKLLANEYANDITVMRLKIILGKFK